MTTASFSLDGPAGRPLSSACTVLSPGASIPSDVFCFMTTVSNFSSAPMRPGADPPVGLELAGLGVRKAVSIQVEEDLERP